MRVPIQNQNRLPLPAPSELARQAALVERIRKEIASAGGAIDFARYMELALYAPGLGYYDAGATPFGEGADFVTAPELSPLFGACLARQCAEILERLGGGDLLEAGAGSGRLAADLLRALTELDALPTRYFILELSPTLRAQQAATLQRELPQFFSRVHWLDLLPEFDFRGVMLANELLDALPVTRFRIGGNGTVLELAVSWRNDGFVWCERPAAVDTLERVAALGLPSGYTSEIGFHAEAWVRSLGERLASGVMLLVDYGFPRAEFYHPQRCQGTLMCHYRHRAHDDPLILTGLQDISAHVDFTAIAAAAQEAGLELLGYTSQAAFLLGCGLDKFVQAAAPDIRAQLERAQTVKKLTLPHEMGEIFKVIAFGRGLPGPALCGFSLQDRRARL